MASFEITGNVMDRFVQSAALLRKLEPVRGEPTVYGLDQNVDNGSPRERVLKRKFLDSFALVCATQQNGGSVSAACLEEGRPEGTVVRVSSNAGVSAPTLNGLRELVRMLSCIANNEPNTSYGERNVLLNIICLDIHKIQGYLRKLRGLEEAFLSSIAALNAHPVWSSTNTDIDLRERFEQWIQSISPIFTLPATSTPETLLEYIRHAQIARRDYAEFFEALPSDRSWAFPKWVMLIFKIGRYGIASRALTQFAKECPALFSPMTVEPVPAPSRIRYVAHRNSKPLMSVLRRAVGSGFTDSCITQLSTIWNTQDAEADLQSDFPRHLLVHAEVQLISFYDHYPEQKPQFTFIGVSKKSCYLCHLFLTTNPGSYSVSSCHQKLYPTWMPPSATNLLVYKQYRTVISTMSEVIEASIKEHLDVRLHSAGRQPVLDSTAGVSLTGLTNRTFGRSIADRTYHERTDSGSSTPVDDSFLTGAQIQAHGPSFSDVSQLPTTYAESVIWSEAQPAAAQHRPRVTRESSIGSISDMVFHIVRKDDASMQDIICLQDTLDASSGLPSWAKLIDLLQTDDDSGVAYSEGHDFLLVGGKIRVANERQLRACVQYFLNVGTMNIDTDVCTSVV